jgi:hypothetical protein
MIDPVVQKALDNRYLHETIVDLKEHGAKVYFIDTKLPLFRTIACGIIHPDGRVAAGYTSCSPDDTFSLTRGKRLALAAAVKMLDEGRAKLYSKPIPENVIKIGLLGMAIIARDTAMQAKATYIARKFQNVLRKTERELFKAGYAIERVDAPPSKGVNFPPQFFTGRFDGQENIN